ncbi:putative protein [Richelia intracellularis HM01]|uniref:Uma2 family endonuclease n=1 Tax=Richelia intracellularis TaxID=1164990 RepID=UPI0002B56983|nr:Uma2 family endonuclease [Richelia intracellularis]CCH65570.1 putative protein [Richelia intracellularis HM01]
MVLIQNEYYISEQEYLNKEKISTIKHEYIDGQVYQVSSTRSDAHVTINLNLASLLLGQLRSKGYRVYMADMKVQIEAINRYFYPDILLTGDLRDKEYKYFKRYPCLIVEIISDMTEAYDRGKKFADYRQLKTLKEYVLISQDIMSVECFRRNEYGRWELFPYTRGNKVDFASVDVCFDIGNIYEDVDLIIDNTP